MTNKRANLNLERLRAAGADLGNAPGTVQFKTPSGHTVTTPYSDESIRHQVNRLGSEDAYYASLAQALKTHGEETDLRVEKQRDEDVSSTRAGNAILGGAAGGLTGAILGAASRHPMGPSALGLAGMLAGGYLGHQAKVDRKHGPSKESIREIEQLYTEPAHVKEMRQRVNQLRREIEQDAQWRDFRRDLRNDLRYGYAYPYGYGGRGSEYGYKFSAEKTAAPSAIDRFIVGRNSRQFGRRLLGTTGAGLGAALGTVGGGILGAYNAAPGEGFSGALSGAAKGLATGAALGGAGGAALGHFSDPAILKKERAAHAREAGIRFKPKRRDVHGAPPDAGAGAAGPPAAATAEVPVAAPPRRTRKNPVGTPADPPAKRPRGRNPPAPATTAPATTAPAATTPAAATGRRTRRQNPTAPAATAPAATAPAATAPAATAPAATAPATPTPARTVTSSGAPVTAPDGATGLTPIRPTDIPQQPVRAPLRRRRPVGPDTAQMVADMGMEVNSSLKTAAYLRALERVFNR